MVELKESKVASSINKLPYDRTSQLALLEAIEKVQQRIKEVDDLDSQNNLVQNRDANSDLDAIINEIIERVKQAKTLQQEIKMNEQIIQTVKAAEKSNGNIELDQGNDAEVEQIFIETVTTTDDISKKKNKVKFEDIQYSELSTDQETVSIGIMEQNIGPETKPIKTETKGTFFKVDETDSYIEYMKDSSASQYNPEEFVQVEWDNDLLELNAQIYRSIKSKRDYLSKREKANEKAKSMEKEAGPAAEVALTAASQKSVNEDFDKYFTQEDFTKVERAPDTTYDINNNNNKQGAPDGFKYTDKAIADMDEFSRQKQTRESQKKAKPFDKIKTRIKGGVKGNKSAISKDQKPKTEKSMSLKEKVLGKIQSVKKSRSDKKTVKTEQFVKSKKSKKPKIKLEDLKKKIRK